MREIKFRGKRFDNGLFSKFLKQEAESDED